MYLIDGNLCVYTANALSHNSLPRLALLSDIVSEQLTFESPPGPHISMSEFKRILRLEENRYKTWHLPYQLQGHHAL